MGEVPKVNGIWEIEHDTYKFSVVKGGKTLNSMKALSNVRLYNYVNKQAEVAYRACYNIHVKKYVRLLLPEEFLR